jgi:hypothetical protein
MASPYAPITQAAAGSTTIVAGVAGNKIRLLALAGQMAATGTVQIKSTGGTALSGAMNWAAGGPTSLPYCPEGWCETPVGEGLVITSVTGAFNGLAVVDFNPG